MFDMVEKAASKVLIIPKEVKRKYDSEKYCVFFMLPTGKYLDLLFREYISVTGGTYRMPISEITPYREKQVEETVMSRNIVASFITANNGEMILSRKSAIIGQYGLYKQGDVVNGYVSGSISTGIFIDFGQGVRGFCPYEEVSNLNFLRPNKLIQTGNNVNAKITMIDKSYPYHIHLSIKKAARKREVEMKEEGNELISVVVGNPLPDGSGAFCEITPTQIGIMDSAPRFTPSVKLAGREAWAIVKCVKHSFDSYGNVVDKFKLEFVCWRDEIF